MVLNFVPYAGFGVSGRQPVYLCLAARWAHNGEHCAQTGRSKRTGGEVAILSAPPHAAACLRLQAR